MSLFAQKHTCKSVDQDLARIQGLLDALWDSVELRLESALSTLDDPRLASAFPSDEPVDQAYREVERQLIRFIALRQPVADDLRFIVASLRASIDLERVGDHAASIARRVRAGGVCGALDVAGDLAGMGRLAQTSLKELRAAFCHWDVELAKRTEERDEEINGLHSSVSERLRRHMAESPSDVDRCSHLLFVCKSLERIGDHAKNIAEHVQYMAQGDIPPKDKDAIADAQSC